MSVVQHENRKLPELDALRGIAAFWVLLYHYIFIYSHNSGTRSAFWFQIPDYPEKALGMLPVYLFFMISGFVISMSVKENTTLGSFALSRFSRLFPSYWVGVCLTGAVGALVPVFDQHYSLVQFATNLTMLQSVVGQPDIDGVYWSLLVELLFYFFMGLLIVGDKLKYRNALFLVWAIACLLNSASPHFGVDFIWRFQKYANLLYGHFLIAGSMYYQIWRHGESRIARIAILVCAASILFSYVLPVALSCLMLFALFEAMIRDRLRRLAVPPLLWLGGISYTLYLTHQMLGYRLIATLTGAGLPLEAAMILTAGAAMTLAMGISILVERPAMAALRRGGRRAEDDLMKDQGAGRELA